MGGTNPSLLQALGAGAPTLALDTPFNAEVIPYSAQLFTHDAGALAERISTVATSQHIQGQMARLGRSVVAQRYSWDDVCGAYLDTLARLARERPRRRSDSLAA